MIFTIIMYMCGGVISTKCAFIVFHLISTLARGHSIIISEEREVQREEVTSPGPSLSISDRART